MAEQKRQHKATYARDKFKGGYNIRVQGPNAAKFAGCEVPVTQMSGEEHNEKLIKLIWSGVDTGTADKKGTGEPIALYTFEAKPREEEPLNF